MVQGTSGNRGRTREIVRTKEQGAHWLSRYKGLEDQLAQRNRGTVGTEEQRTSGNRGPVGTED